MKSINNLRILRANIWTTTYDGAKHSLNMLAVHIQILQIYIIDHRNKGIQIRETSKHLYKQVYT